MQSIVRRVAEHLDRVRLRAGAARPSRPGLYSRIVERPAGSTPSPAVPVTEARRVVAAAGAEVARSEVARLRSRLNR